jgi:Icc-related predicted phosphoesterase
MIKKIVAMADLHGYLPNRIPACDLLLIAGDICPDYKPQREWLDRDFRRWLGRIPARHVVATWGNHDFAGEAGDVPKLRCSVLVDETIEIEGVRIHGTPWTPVCSRFAFTEDEDVLEGCFNRIPSDVDILISHGPPRGWVDLSRYGTHDGSVALLAAVERARPALTICGHVHEARAGATAPWGRIENVSAVDQRRIQRRHSFVKLTWKDHKRA